MQTQTALQLLCCSLFFCPFLSFSVPENGTSTAQSNPVCLQVFSAEQTSEDAAPGPCVGTCPGCLGCLCECCGFVGNASLLTNTNATEQDISGAEAAALASSSHFYVASNDNCEAMPPTGLGWDGAQYNISQAMQRTYASYACRFNVRQTPFHGLRSFYGCSYMFHMSGDNSRDRHIKGSWQGP